VRAASLIGAPGLLLRSASALRHGRQARIPGLEFDAFGRRLGLRLLRSGHVGLGASYLLNPVSIVRYFEFPFVAKAIPAGARLCADVSSPRLFSLFWAATHSEAAIQMINPDEHDLEETRVVAASAGVALELMNDDVRAFQDRPHAYDAIWSISVLEHVHGEYDDREAIAWLYAALRPGGRLLGHVATLEMLSACYPLLKGLAGAVQVLLVDLARGVELVETPSIAGAQVQRAIRPARHAPYLGLVRGVDGIQLGADRKVAVASEREALHAAAQKILVAGHFPGSGRRGERKRSSE